MGITDAFDKLVKLNQDNCEHPEQDLIKMPDGEFCTCGRKIR